jgi:hypothetical protein
VPAALQRDGGKVLRLVAEDVADAHAVSDLRERVAEALGQRVGVLGPGPASSENYGSVRFCVILR